MGVDAQLHEFLTSTMELKECLYAPVANSRYLLGTWLCMYSSFGTWWHTVTHGRGNEGETGEWSG